jgi:hypothetical protein
MRTCLHNLSLFTFISIVSICSLNIQLLKVSSSNIDKERPIIANDFIFYLRMSEIKADKLDNSLSNYGMFGKTYRKPLLNKDTRWGNGVFLTKDCRLEMWEYRGKNTLDGGHILFQRSFNELKGDFCYDSLDMFYHDNDEDIAVYNSKYNKITVFNFKEKNIYGTSDDIVKKVEMDYNILQTLIYNYNGDTTILIGIDIFNINFYNLRGTYSWSDWFKSWVKGNRLIKSIKLKNYSYSSYGKKIAGIMEIDNKKDKLLYIDDKVYLYDIKEFKSIASLYLDRPSTVLTLKNGNALVGNELGKIYLIKFSGKLNILESFNICNGKVIDISYDNTKFYYYKYYLLIQCEEENGYYYKYILLDNIY